MYALLVERDLAAAVEGPVAAPSAATRQGSDTADIEIAAASVEARTPADAAAQITQKKAHALITLNVSSHLLHLIEPEASARQVWAALHRHFNGHALS